MNIREKILNAKDIKEEEVYVEEWDVTVLVRGLTGAERAKFLKATTNDDGIDYAKLYPMLLIASVFDPETKEKVFEITDKDMINGKSSSAIEEIGKVAMKLAGLDGNSKKEIKNA